jgi:hypothetical protein
LPSGRRYEFSFDESTGLYLSRVGASASMVVGQFTVEQKKKLHERLNHASDEQMIALLCNTILNVFRHIGEIHVYFTTLSTVLKGKLQERGPSIRNRCRLSMISLEPTSLHLRRMKLTNSFNLPSNLWFALRWCFPPFHFQPSPPSIPSIEKTECHYQMVPDPTIRMGHPFLPGLNSRRLSRCFTSIQDSISSQLLVLRSSSSDLLVFNFF